MSNIRPVNSIFFEVGEVGKPEETFRKLEKEGRVKRGEVICTFCQQEFKATEGRTQEELCLQLTCGHIFHSKCYRGYEAFKKVLKPQCIFRDHGTFDVVTVVKGLGLRMLVSSIPMNHQSLKINLAQANPILQACLEVGDPEELCHLLREGNHIEFLLKTLKLLQKLISESEEIRFESPLPEIPEGLSSIMAKTSEIV